MQYKSLVKRPFWQLLQKPALQRCHCFHATARIEYEYIRREGFKAPVAIIPNGIDIPELGPDDRRAKRIVFLSRIDPVKGLDMLLPAWTAVANDFSDWELVIAGPLIGEYANTIQGLARKLRAHRVKFVGQIFGEAKRELLTSAALFVLPTYSENFGIVVAEALAHGTPVITTTGTPWTDIEQRNCGWCISPEEDELRETLRKAMSQPLPALHEMGKKGREWMQRNYAWPSIAQQMQQTYEWLLHGGIRPDWVVET